MEDLKTKNMTARPKAKKGEDGKWEKNRASAKAGLNKSILDKGWHQVEAFIKYKSFRAGKAFFKVPAHHTSQECAACGHIHPENRKSQAIFDCLGCGTKLNADENASRVIAKRAINLILDPGSGLSEKGVLRLSDTGRGAKNKSRQAKACLAPVAEASKKRGTADITPPEA
jgi:putative transposase